MKLQLSTVNHTVLDKIMILVVLCVKAALRLLQSDH